MYFEKSMSEHRTPEVKSIISELEKRIKEEERKAYIDPVKAEEAKEKGNDSFNKGKYLFFLIYFCYYCIYEPGECRGRVVRERMFWRVKSLVRLCGKPA